MSATVVAGDPTLLPAPELQFVDANGVPYASGTLALYVPGTTTPKDSWIDWQGNTLNENPLTLDAAGRCIVWGDGDYRCVLHDADGNLIFDQISTTLVSAAMVPVVSAPTLQAARDAMGITDAIQAETDRALAAEQALRDGQGTLATQSALDAEIARAEAAEAALQDAIDAERDRAMAAEDALGAVAPNVQSGSGATDAAGNASITFALPFATSCDAVVTNAQLNTWINVTSKSTTGFTCTSTSPLFGGNWQRGPMIFQWIATGH